MDIDIVIDIDMDIDIDNAFLVLSPYVCAIGGVSLQ